MAVKQNAAKTTARGKAPARRVTPGADAQQQILAAADELFYREGARTVGVDAVVKRAGVNKMSLYRQFESKDALLREYLIGRDRRFWDYFEASVDKHPHDPKMQLLQFFADLAARAGKPNYRGCPFVNVAVEYPDRRHPARMAVAANKAQLLGRLRDLAAACGASEPQELANMLAVLIEGAYTASQTYNPARPLLDALPQAAHSLIEAACPPVQKSR